MNRKNDNQCADLQRNADDIVKLLVVLWGVDHITNYFHYIESGHVDFSYEVVTVI